MSIRDSNKIICTNTLVRYPTGPYNISAYLHCTHILYPLYVITICECCKPTNFIGHCCEVGVSINNAKEVVKDSRRIEDGAELLFDGCLHIPGIHILLPSPIVDYVDVHGLGREGEYDLPGLLHDILDRANAMNFYKKN